MNKLLYIPAGKFAGEDAAANRRRELRSRLLLCDECCLMFKQYSYGNDKSWWTDRFDFENAKQALCKTFPQFTTEIMEEDLPWSK